MMDESQSSVSQGRVKQTGNVLKELSHYHYQFKINRKTLSYIG